MTFEYPHRCFPARVLRSLEVGPFVFTETAYAPRLKVPPHSHEYACFVIALRGSFSESYGNKSRQVKPSTLIFRPLGELHSEHFDDGGGRCLNIEIDHDWLQRGTLQSVLRNDSADFRSSSLTSLSSKLYNELREMDEASTLSIEGLTLEIFSAAARSSMKRSNGQPPKWLEQ